MRIQKLYTRSLIYGTHKLLSLFEKIKDLTFFNKFMLYIFLAEICTQVKLADRTCYTRYQSSNQTKLPPALEPLSDGCVTGAFESAEDLKRLHSIYFKTRNPSALTVT